MCFNRKYNNCEVKISWCIMSLSLIIVHFHRSSLALILDYLIVDLNIKDSILLGTLTSATAIISAIMQIPSGLLADTIGPKIVTSTGLLVVSIGTLLFALSSTLFLAFFSRLIIGLGSSVVFIANMKFQSNCFTAKQISTYAGFSLLIGKAGGAFSTMPLAYTVDRLGWRRAFIIFGIITLIISFLTFFLVRDMHQSYKKKEISTKENNMIPNILIALKKITLMPSTWAIFMCTFGFMGSMLAFVNTWGAYYLMQIYSFSRQKAGFYLLVLFIGGAIGYPVIGYISDKLRQRKLPLIILFLIYICLWGSLFFWNNGKPPERTLCYIFFLLGFAGSSFILIPIMMKELNDSSYSATAMSVVNIAPFLGQTITQLIMGYALNVKWDGVIVSGVKIYSQEAYKLLFGYIIIVLIICFIFTLTIREPKSFEL